MRPAQARLHALVERIFEDGIVTAAERSELVAFYRESPLTVSEVKHVFRDFMSRTWGEAISDEVLTDAERVKLATIAAELRLPLDCVPPCVALVLAMP